MAPLADHITSAHPGVGLLWGGVVGSTRDSVWVPLRAARLSQEPPHALPAPARKGVRQDGSVSTIDGERQKLITLRQHIPCRELFVHHHRSSSMITPHRWSTCR